MNARRGRKVIPLAAAGLTVAGVLLIPGLGASAADVASAPGEVWTQLATPLPFSGTDPVSGASRALAIEFGGDEATCVVNTPGTNDFSGDCAGAHFAVFPEALVEPCILSASKEGDTVLDPFTGSGTTGAVSVRLQRNFVGVELNPAYVQLARKRIGDVAPLLAREVA